MLKLFNGRELRSFRLKYFLKSFKNFIEVKDSFGLFFMVHSIAPVERIKLRENLSLYNFKVDLISNKIIKLLLKKKIKNWKYIINLLQGGVVLIKTNFEDISKENLFQKILNHNNFLPRFLYWNNSFFRVNIIKKYVENVLYKKDIKNDIKYILSLFLKKIFVQIYFLKFN